MNILARILQRIGGFAVAIALLWFSAVVVSNHFDHQLLLFLALFSSYAALAYILLPGIIELWLLIVRKGRIPRFTRAKDGIPGDPVNIAVIGSRKALEEAFARAGWFLADRLTLRTGWRMTIAFLFNRPYPRAPFSTLLLFGRPADVGFEKPIGNSPRRRHHVRFWGLHAHTLPDPADPRFWSNTQPTPTEPATLWLGSATKDIGFGFTQLTFQISHRVDTNIDSERARLVADLVRAGCVERVKEYEAGAFTVGKYTSDGRIVVVELTSAHTSVLY